MTADSEWTQFFDYYAPAYDGEVFTRDTVAEVDFLVGELALQPPASILDVGCGTGRHSLELARRGFTVTGLDISVGMLAEARRKAEAEGLAIRWEEADATAFELAEPVDAVVCLCEGAFGLLGSGDDPLAQPLAILRSTARALKVGAPCLFTVLNGYAIARRHDDEAVRQGRFDPLALAEVSECEIPGAKPLLRERGFVPTELSLLFQLAGFVVEHIGGGTAGNWGRRAVELDEFELMVVARKVGG